MIYWPTTEEKEIAELFEEGVIPESEDREVKVGIAYEGWQPIIKEISLRIFQCQ